MATQGLVFEPVAHSGCSVVCEAEIDRIEQIVDALLNGSYCHAEVGGEKRGVLGPEQILVTAPYNVQVNRLQQRLGQRARVGTVDKFQGQEALIVILSLCASAGEYGSRGLGFILDRNRINVAISRAQTLAIVVADPRIASADIRSLEEMRLVNVFCKLRGLG
jgi:uncharacterized protein